MTPEQKMLVRKTWKTLAPEADRVAARFYQRLFAIDPTTPQLFAATDPSNQSQKLVKALTVVVQGLDQLETIAPILSDLGRRHSGYGITERHYESVGKALLWALEHALGLEWTSDIENAWAHAYALVANTMRGRQVA
jgi:hemoglobin-like flavoprotein